MGAGMSQHAALGQNSPYPQAYDAGLLEPVPRRLGRAALGLPAPLPWDGVDLWTGYELSWLDRDGRPRVAVAEFRVPASSPALIESKSFKLYLNSLNAMPLADAAAVQALLQRDLSAVAGAPVAVQLRLPADFGGASVELPGRCIDDLELGPLAPAPAVDPDLLRAAGPQLQERLLTHLFCSNCPVTGQPDWASLMLHVRGPTLDPAALLRYLVSYRRHSGFHEQCVERVFADVWQRCRPEALTVYARFTRRGGLDINPFRSSFEAPPSAWARNYRQ